MLLPKGDPEASDNLLEVEFAFPELVRDQLFATWRVPHQPFWSSEPIRSTVGGRALIVVDDDRPVVLDRFRLVRLPDPAPAGPS